jgi:hypothetical protein
MPNGRISERNHEKRSSGDYKLLWKRGGLFEILSKLIIVGTVISLRSRVMVPGFSPAPFENSCLNHIHHQNGRNFMGRFHPIIRIKQCIFKASI